MRKELSTSEDLAYQDIITYGCSAHLLNLSARDVEIIGVAEHVKEVVKYFRNHHFAAAKYKQFKGKKLVLPQEVRWNTLADCLESYLDNWHILSAICTEHRAAIEAKIIKKVNDFNLKMRIESYLNKLKKIAIALDKVQSDQCCIGEATEIWINLKKVFL